MGSRLFKEGSVGGVQCCEFIYAIVLYLNKMNFDTFNKSIKLERDIKKKSLSHK